MQRAIVTSAKRAYSSSARVMAAEAATSLQINFSTPHQNIFKKKAVNQVILPGEKGEFSVSLGHSALISQLKPGVVSVYHTTVGSNRCITIVLTMSILGRDREVLRSRWIFHY